VANLKGVAIRSINNRRSAIILILFGDYFEKNTIYMVFPRSCVDERWVNPTMGRQRFKGEDIDCHCFHGLDCTAAWGLVDFKSEEGVRAWHQAFATANIN
jgi:hypothetical protein